MKSIFDFVVGLLIWPIVTPVLWLRHRNTIGVAFERLGGKNDLAYFYIGKLGDQTKDMRRLVKEFFKLNKKDKDGKPQWHRCYGSYTVPDKDVAWAFREALNNEMGVPISTSCALGLIVEVN